MPAPTDPTDPRGGYSRLEDDVIERIAQRVGQSTVPAGERHIGDDAAVLAPFVGQAVISTDVAVLGVHLDSRYFPLEDLGFKAVAAAVSDLAAMGARPRGAVVAVTAYREWVSSQRAMRHGDPLPRSVMPRLLSAIVAVMAALSAIVVLISALH